jgi:hypothetical protein
MSLEIYTLVIYLIGGVLTWTLTHQVDETIIFKAVCILFWPIAITLAFIFFLITKPIERQ